MYFACNPTSCPSHARVPTQLAAQASRCCLRLVSPRDMKAPSTSKPTIDSTNTDPPPSLPHSADDQLLRCPSLQPITARLRCPPTAAHKLSQTGHRLHRQDESNLCASERGTVPPLGQPLPQIFKNTPTPCHATPGLPTTSHSTPPASAPPSPGNTNDRRQKHNNNQPTHKHTHTHSHRQTSIP